LNPDPSIDISVVVVTYNSAPCLDQCVRSLRAQQDVATEIILVDNVSADDTLAVARRLGPGLQLIANSENIGFGRACNQAFAASRGRFLYLLNPDAEIERRDTLASLRQALERHPRWGLAGTRILTPEGEVQDAETAYPDQHRVRCDFSHLPGAVAWVSGASMFIRREAFAAVEGFDPAFFLSSEETDLCLRLRQRGWEIGFLPELTVKHIGMASEQSHDPYQTWSRRLPGMHRFWAKHYPAAEVRRLVRRDVLRAGFRAGWYGLLASAAGRSSNAWRKHRRYAAIRDVSRRFLRHGPADAFPRG
jgi:N-acetylglucosaminyl-diphospho-decaprenol L-rhamnosyltransferase